MLMMLIWLLRIRLYAYKLLLKNRRKLINADAATTC